MTAASPGSGATRRYDVAVIGGGPAGATAAHELARDGFSCVLIDRGGRVKPCGGAVPPRLLEAFDVPESRLVNRVDTARIISPSGLEVDIPVGEGFVGMVDRGPFDDWLRSRAASAGAERVTGTFREIDRDGDGVLVSYGEGPERDAPDATLRARCVIGADGALSRVARQEIRGADRARFVFAYHEVVRSPEPDMPGVAFDAARCDVVYDGRFSPDFYSWVFPHGPETSVGLGTMQKGFPMRRAVADLRQRTGLDVVETIRGEGAPIPLRPLPRWDNGRDVVVAGDAAGVVAPASGEGIYYAMLSGRLAARAVHESLRTGDPRRLGLARRGFMREHRSVFFVLGVMQRFWYRSDLRREGFASICQDEDVQQLTFEGYMRKRLVRARPAAHARIFFKNIGHLTGVLRPTRGPDTSGLTRTEAASAETEVAA